jgi:hypothetical protein
MVEERKKRTDWGEMERGEGASEGGGGGGRGVIATQGNRRLEG